jgi:hypothetical protein
MIGLKLQDIRSFCMIKLSKFRNEFCFQFWVRLGKQFVKLLPIVSSLKPNDRSQTCDENRACLFGNRLEEPFAVRKSHLLGRRLA